MTKIVKEGIPSVDSLQLRIELSRLKSFDKTLTNTILHVNEETSEIEKKVKRKKNQYEFDNFSFYASIVRNVRVSKTSQSDCIILLINAKQLGVHYFDGITKDTISIIFDKLIEHKIIDCSFDTFIFHSYPTDIDVKKDYRLPLDEWKEVKKVTETMTKPSNKSKAGCNVFETGIEWSKRTTTQYKTNPFLKIYHKETELKTKSIDFANRYLSDIDFTNVFRIEATIKDRAHLRQLNLGLKDFNLKELLSLTEEQLNSVISNSINAHLSPRTKSLAFKNKSKLTPTKQIYLMSLLALVNELNYTDDRAINYLLSNVENKTSKSLNKATLKQLYNDEIKGTDYDSKSTKIDNIFDSFGWF